MGPVQGKQTVTDGHLGRVLANQYRLDSVLGKGGMGTVYRGTQLSVDRPVAIKLISGNTHNPELVQRFRREAELMSKLEHPSVVRLYDFGLTDDGLLYLVMELINGGDLSQVLNRTGAFAPDRALRITLRILNALRKAHETGIVHRDLKPQNIITMTLDGDPDHVKIMDFGIARLHEADNQLTSTGAIMGTPAYMSPEQAQGVPVDARADLYSTGVILFVLLTGRIPFEANTAVAMLMKHVSHPPPRVHEVRPDLALAPMVQDLLDRLLAKDPNDRPTSAAEAATMVHRALEATAAGQVYTAAQLPAVAPAVPLGPHGLPPTRAPGAAAPSPAAASPAASASVPAAIAQPSMVAGPQHASMIAPQPYNPHGDGKRKLIIAAFVGAVGVACAVAAIILAGGDKTTTTAATEPTTEASPMETVTIASTPPKASVFLGGAELGVTPFELKFRQETVLEVRADGFQPTTVTVTPGGDPTIVAKLFPEGTEIPVEADDKDEPPVATASGDKPGTKVAVKDKAGADGRQPIEPDWDEKPSSGGPGTTTPRTGPTTEKKRGGIKGLLDRTTDKVAGVAGVDGLGKRRERRAEMERRGPRYRNASSAKRAFNAGKISKTEYGDTIWVLKRYRTRKRDHARKQFNAGRLSEPQYNARLDKIEREYQGN